MSRVPDTPVKTAATILPSVGLSEVPGPVGHRRHSDADVQEAVHSGTVCEARHSLLKATFTDNTK